MFSLVSILRQLKLFKLYAKSFSDSIQALSDLRDVFGLHYVYRSLLVFDKDLCELEQIRELTNTTKENSVRSRIKHLPDTK